MIYLKKLIKEFEGHSISIITVLLITISYHYRNNYNEFWDYHNWVKYGLGFIISFILFTHLKWYFDKS